MYVEAIESILADHCTSGHVRAIERGASSQPIFAAIRDAGFLELMTPEALGGAGADWADFCEVIMALGARAMPVPLAQTLAARSFARQPAELPKTLLTFAPTLRREGDSLLAATVPGAAAATHVIGALEDRLVMLPVDAARQTPCGIHGSLSASLAWPPSAAQQLQARIDPGQLQPIAALMHAGLLAGAMTRTFELTMAYANDRVQFGKTIGKFQAIQHQLSVMAEQVCAARMAAQVAFGNAQAWPGAAACAVAKGRASEAAQVVASTAHAVHGAIGITEEYDLQLFTRRLHEWRLAHGSESFWYRELGRRFLGSDTNLSTDFVRALA